MRDSLGVCTFGSLAFTLAGSGLDLAFIGANLGFCLTFIWSLVLLLLPVLLLLVSVSSCFSSPPPS